MNKSRTTRSNQEENTKINDAMNVLLEKDKSEENKNINNKSISSKDISHDFAFINNVRIEPRKINEFSSEFSNKNNNYNYNSKTNNFNSDTSNNYYNSKSVGSLTTDKNVLSKHVESISTRKRNMINDNINKFENRLNYY